MKPCKSLLENFFKKLHNGEMTIPKRDQILLLIVGVTLAAAGLFVSHRPQQLAYNEQDPIDVKSLTSEYDPTQTQGEFHGRQVASVEVKNAANSQVLGVSDDSKRIEVDLTNQRLYAYEGDRKVYDFLVSTGKWGRTPKGVFRIANKFRYTKMSGGSQALHTYYYLPNVPFVMFFGNSEVPASRGFSLHGTYWHSNFGHPMSHGCVNMKTEEAEIIYNWSLPTTDGKRSALASKDNPGTQVTIYGETPNE